MNTHILTETDFDAFIQEEIIPSITRSWNKSGMTGALVFALVGDLGAGKTTFSKKLIQAFGVTDSVTSPTFSIINSYLITRSRNESRMTDIDFEKIYHIDVYRIEDVKELDVLHFDKILSEQNTIVVIEWADMIREKIPANAVWIEFEHDTIETRKVSVRTDKR